MTPEYLNELADIADPEKLWRRAGLDRLDFTPEQKRQLDTGVALRRHAHHVQRVRELIGTGKSLVITPLYQSGTAVMTIPAPAEHEKLLKLPEPVLGAAVPPVSTFDQGENDECD